MNFDGGNIAQFVNPSFEDNGGSTDGWEKYYDQGVTVTADYATDGIFSCNILYDDYYIRQTIDLTNVNTIFFDVAYTNSVGNDAFILYKIGDVEKTQNIQAAAAAGTFQRVAIDVSADKGRQAVSIYGGYFSYLDNFETSKEHCDLFNLPNFANPDFSVWAERLPLQSDPNNWNPVMPYTFPWGWNCIGVLVYLPPRDNWSNGLRSAFIFGSSNEQRYVEQELDVTRANVISFDIGGYRDTGERTFYVYIDGDVAQSYSVVISDSDFGKKGLVALNPTFPYELDVSALSGKHLFRFGIEDDGVQMSLALNNIRTR